jgi:acyl-CoA reductase-like NAD-dependent aldehyde dehydrogenase
MSELLRQYIGGSWVEGGNGETFERRNPATGELVATYAKGTVGDVENAVAAAKRAFSSWRLYPAPKRGELLYHVAQVMERRKEELAREMTQEMGKVIDEARGDVQEAIDMTYYMAGEGRRMWGETTPSELRDKFNMSVRKSIGVCGIVTPWNFPMAIRSWKMMPALIAGNTIVFKPASFTPRSAMRLVEILEEAGIPEGVVNLVMGSGDEIGSAIINHPDVALISFTGSTDTGTEVALQAARRNKRLSLEMGGKNAVIVMDDADFGLATDVILWSAFGTSGQRCTAASRVVVHRSVQRELAERLVERAGGMKLGNGLDDAVDIGPVISRRQLETVAGYVRIGEHEGARLISGGSVVDEGDLRLGFFHQPTIFDDVASSMRIAQEEIFGPVTALIPVDSLEEAVNVVNSIEYGLSASIFTADVNRAFRAMQDIFTGILYVNAGTTGAEIHLPFGGTKATGNGHREAGTAALDFFTEWQSIYVDYSGRLQRAQIDPVEASGRSLESSSWIGQTIRSRVP